MRRAFDTPATAGLALLTIIVSGVILLTGYDQAAALWGGFIPARVAGTSYFADTYNLAPVWLTPLTATLVHAGLAHLFFNMIMLGYTGHQTERAIGWRGVLLLYLLGAYVSTGAQWLAGPNTQMPMIGASGAISAIVGAYSLLYSRPDRAKAIGPIPARYVYVLWLAAAWVGLNLLMGFVSRQAGMPIAAAAHIGGFILGLALARPLLAWHWRHA